MAALSFIGKPISLISHSDVRYRGILAGIDHIQSTIQLSNVFSMGTEERKPPAEFIPPVRDPYTYIIFRASEVKDLAVDDQEALTPPRSVHDDPAVLGVSGAYTPPYAVHPFSRQPSSGPSSGGPQSSGPAQAAPYAQQPPSGPQQPGQVPAVQVQTNGTAAAPPRSNGRNASVNSATASLETIERAIDDLRVSHATAGANGASTQTHRGGRRGGASTRPQGILPVPATDFDFESSNARFDKASLAPSARGTPKSEGEGEGVEADGEEKDKEEEGKTVAYNPKKSFFDSLSSGSNGPSGDGRGRGGRRGGRNRREEERERNFATFGEPGGVGLMGPSAYVGGWGYGGRRGGGGRGRRGGAVPSSRS